MYEEDALIQMQTILKQRQIEISRHQLQMKAIEDSQRRAQFAFDRRKDEFLNSLRTKRENWWKSDEAIRRDLSIKKDFRILMERLQYEMIDNGEIKEFNEKIQVLN